MELYGGGYSSEWFVSKVLETLEEAPEVYAAADRFLEAGDWLVGRLVGRESRSECAAGYKAMWLKGAGWPSADFFKALNPGLEDVIADKVESRLIPVGRKAGELTAEMAELTGLTLGTSVAAHDYFGRGANDVIKRLKELRRQPA